MTLIRASELIDRAGGPACQTTKARSLLWISSPSLNVACTTSTPGRDVFLMPLIWTPLTVGPSLVSALPSALVATDSVKFASGPLSTLKLTVTLDLPLFSQSVTAAVKLAVSLETSSGFAGPLR